MPINNLNAIPRLYHQRQRLRIEASRKRIASAAKMHSLGRVIPDPADLVIGKGRHLVASVLFLDISGFTGMPAGTVLEQDTMVRVLSLLFGEMIRIVGDYGGTVEKSTGDGIMAYYSSHPDCAGDTRHRALASALTMFHALDFFINPAIRATGLDSLSFRICIDYGAITIARLGAAKRFNHIVAVGNTANRACKMLAHANRDEILIGDAMLDGLPAEWLNRLGIKSADTGWSHTDGRPYIYWEFDGRWSDPTLRAA
jgi:adenylate cyclase